MMIPPPPPPLAPDPSADKEEVVFELSGDEDEEFRVREQPPSDDEVSLYCDALSRKTSEKSIVVPMF